MRGFVLFYDISSEFDLIVKQGHKSSIKIHLNASLRVN